MNIILNLNDETKHLDVEPFRRLLDILRDELAITSVKEGCGKGECGACAVLMNGRRINACLVPALQLDNSRIYTLEGMIKWPVFKKIENIFVDHGAVQCGYCIPGMVISTMAFLEENPLPYSRDQVAQGLAGNICRCTGYTKIIDAIIDMGNQKRIKKEINEIWPT